MRQEGREGGREGNQREEEEEEAGNGGRRDREGWGKGEMIGRKGRRCVLL